MQNELLVNHKMNPRLCWDIDLPQFDRIIRRIKSEEKFNSLLSGVLSVISLVCQILKGLTIQCLSTKHKSTGKLILRQYAIKKIHMVWIVQLGSFLCLESLSEERMLRLEA